MSGCEECPAHTRAQNGNRVCAADECVSEKEHVNAEGKCEVCPKLTEPSKDRLKCVELMGIPKNLCDDR